MSDIPRGNSPMSSDSAAGRASQDTAPARVKTKEEKGTLRTEAADAAEAVKTEAAKQFDRARNSASSFAGEQKNAAAERLAAIATALSKAAVELEEEQPTIAAYTQKIASRIDRASSDFKNRDVDSLVGMAEEFGRRQPAAMLGIAAIAGFMSGRFLMASGRRRDTAPGAAARDGSSQPPPSYPRRDSPRR